MTFNKEIVKINHRINLKISSPVIYFTGRVFIGVLAALLLFAAILVTPAEAQETKAVDIDLVPNGLGFWITHDNGWIESRGGAPYLEFDLVSSNTHVIALMPADIGHWIVNNSGEVRNLGGAQHLGDVSDLSLNESIIAAVPTTTRRGYFLLTSDGDVFVFGDAKFYGSIQEMLNIRYESEDNVLASDWLTAPIVAMSVTVAGYWLVSADGSIYSFGDAVYHGSIQDVVNQQVEEDILAAQWLTAPIIRMISSLSDVGYLMLSADGGIFNFGQAPFHGSVAEKSLAPAVAIDIADNNTGYIILTADGQIWMNGVILTVFPYGEKWGSSFDANNLSALDDLCAWQLSLFGKGQQRTFGEDLAREFIATVKRVDSVQYHKELDKCIEYGDSISEVCLTLLDQGHTTREIIRKIKSPDSKSTYNLTLAESRDLYMYYCQPIDADTNILDQRDISCARFLAMFETGAVTPVQEVAAREKMAIAKRRGADLYYDSVDTCSSYQKDIRLNCLQLSPVEAGVILLRSNSNFTTKEVAEIVVNLCDMRYYS